MGMLLHRKSVNKATNKVKKGAVDSAPTTVEPTQKKAVKKATNSKAKAE